MNFETSYLYDALGNLARVTQGGQNRYFKYDSLSRLVRARNPEQGLNSSLSVADAITGNSQWSVGYSYDDASNLLTMTNPNATTVSFSYDGMNRVKTKTLSTGGTWSYGYDTATLGKGLLASVVLNESTDGNYYLGYDTLGRITSSRQITTAEGQARGYTFEYAYDLVGNLTRQVYPSGKVIITELDAAGRIAGVKKQGGGYYAGASPTDSTNRMQYSAHGAVAAMKLGNQKWEHTLFNARLQPTEIGLGNNGSDSSLLKLVYTYGASANNNGNIITQTITAPKTAGGSLVLSQSYGYDSLNRLTQATESLSGSQQWQQVYDMDRWGNRAVTSTSFMPAPSLTPQSAHSTDFSAFDQSTNRLSQSKHPNVLYDASGNLTRDIVASTFIYDAENRQTRSTVGGVVADYSYDADGRRVKKAVGTTTTVFVYNAMGQLVAEYDNVNTLPLNAVKYVTADHLGSTRVVTDASGNVSARYDYLPYGEELASSTGSRSTVAGYQTTDSIRQKFTSKERDTESGLDYFLARYYSSAQGRFTSPDEFTGGPDEFWVLGSGESEKQALPYAEITEPQTLNKYQYCLNNPLRYIDPDGHQQKDNDKYRAFVNYVHSAGVHGGHVGLRDGGLRMRYDFRSHRLPRTEAGSRMRSQYQKETYKKLTPFGKAYTAKLVEARKDRILKPESANKPNEDVTRLGKRWAAAGAVLTTASVGLSIYNVTTAPEGQKVQAVKEEGGGWAGAIAGGSMGAKAGSVFGPYGALAGGVVGAIFGGTAGREVVTPAPSTSGTIMNTTRPVFPGDKRVF